MKKFLLLPLILAVGFGILVILSSQSNSKEEDYSDFVTTDSGLKYKHLKEGDGKEAKPHDTVTVHYTGWLTNGKQFDSSRDHGGGEPSTFSLDGVVKGWGEGIPGMKVGGKRKLVIPPELGYGSKGYPPDIPPNAVLVFEVELVDVKPPRSSESPMP
jgi:FKBP-type peptidyl-prolyl cis-trans isomerase